MGADNSKPEDIRSIPIIKQQKMDCWAHSVSRNFVRTLQILCVIKSKFLQQFYDLFYTILTEYKTCEEGYIILDAMYFLLIYLKNNYNKKIFEITYNDNKCTQLYCTNTGIILNIDEENKSQIISDLKYLFDNNILFIGKYPYMVNPKGNNKPTRPIKKMLHYRLQPVVNVNISNFLYTQIRKKTINYPSVEEKLNFDNKCITHTLYSHAVNLRKWQENYIEFKNSWGSFTSNKGNFSVADLKFIICVKNDINDIKDNIKFLSLMFDYYKLDTSYKLRVSKKYNSYHPTIDIKLEIKDIKKNGEMFYSNGDKFKGIWLDDIKRHGQLFYSNGDRFEGQLINDKINGKGKLDYANGDRFEGEWIDDKINGKGTMKYANGDRFEGEWIDDKINGKGTMKYANGDRFEGEWIDNKINGKGTMKYANGESYVGDWFNDQKYGHGIYTYADGNIYTGNWFIDVKNGKGTMNYANRDTYNGDWDNDKKNGYGVCEYADGTIYEGTWDNDKKDQNKNKYIKYKLKYLKLKQLMVKPQK
jgi:hypothetical protein